jgi:hypothetical protein
VNKGKKRKGRGVCKPQPECDAAISC